MASTLDLKVGNYVKIGTTNTQLTQQDIDDIANNVKTYTPIALTTTWLTDLGFVVYYDNSVNLIFYNKENVYIYLSPVRLVADIYFNDDLQASVDCVHQIQNVYLALQGGVMLSK